MLQRIITAAALIMVLLVVLLVGGWAFDIAAVLMALLGCFEMERAFVSVGYVPARWTAYVMAVLMLPVYRLLGIVGIYVLGLSSALVILLQIALRSRVRWVDAAASLNVIISVPLPMMMLYAIIRIPPDDLGTLMVLSAFVIALVGDTFAYFVGITFGKHKMAPELSPKKTWEGSAAGLLGSVVGALLLCTSGSALTEMPPVWHFLLLGLLGGVAGQLGDLSASLVKRHCGIKDFGTIFPGHGGVMDRLDSVFFVVYVLFGYCLVSGLIG